METKRFKTKQEFEKEFGKDWENIIGWNDISAMDYLFGCIYTGNEQMCIPEKYAKNLFYDNSWCINKDMLTTKPHPYSKGKWYVEVPDGKHDVVQAKALACGFKWLADSKWNYVFNDYLYIDNGILTYGILEDKDDYTKLTFDQFMSGDIPEQEEEKETNETIKVKIIKDNNWYRKGEIYEVLNKISFTASHNVPYFKRDDFYGIRCSDCEILTPEEFDRLTKKPLKFRDWEIEKIGNSAIKVGKYGYCLDGVEEFSNNLSIMFLHYPDITLEEIKEIPKLIDKI